ncbi:three-helix bundle dimerization domain-containing protein [Rhodococcus sp. NPDC057529]|uniref:three-helix bundle dimerization domain-containing protein n=1 Tax=Rhodococcus sp. NPDC057529 TaxID=3346158 RepID=UPI00366EF4B5
MSIDEENRQVERVVDRLAGVHADLPHQRVEQIVHEAHAAFDAGRVRDFIPLLVERSAKRTIATLAGS